MRHVRALLALFFACALLISGFPLGTASPVAAQEGDAVPVTDEAGAAVGSITVTEVVDPFIDFDPAYPPEEGGRYVAVNVAFDADAGNRFDIAPYAIVLQDDAGFLWNQASMVLAEDALIPELSSQTLASGQPGHRCCRFRCAGGAIAGADPVPTGEQPGDPSVGSHRRGTAGAGGGRLDRRFGGWKRIGDGDRGRRPL